MITDMAFSKIKNSWRLLYLFPLKTILFNDIILPYYNKRKVLQK